MKPPVQHTITVGTVNNLRGGKSENRPGFPVGVEFYFFGTMSVPAVGTRVISSN